MAYITGYQGLTTTNRRVEGLMADFSGLINLEKVVDSVLHRLALQENVTKQADLVKGGTISNGTATNSGGNIFTTGKLVMSGGKVEGGTGKYGGNIYSYNGAEITMSGGTVTRGEYLKAAVVYQKGENALFEITGGVLDGTKDGSGAQMGAITAWSGSTVTVNGGTVQGNPKSLYAYSATVNIHAGTVEGNQLYSGPTWESTMEPTVFTLKNDVLVIAELSEAFGFEAEFIRITEE
mgnify:CR=1 FL=1